MTREVSLGAFFEDILFTKYKWFILFIYSNIQKCIISMPKIVISIDYGWRNDPFGSPLDDADPLLGSHNVAMRKRN